MKTCQLWKADTCSPSTESLLDSLKVKTRLAIKRHLSTLNAPVSLDILNNTSAGTLNLLLVLKDFALAYLAASVVPSSTEGTKGPITMY